MLKSLFAFFFIFAFQAWGNSSCDEAILANEMAFQDNFFAYVKFLEQEKIIEIADIEKLQKSLGQTKLYNPVPHEHSTMGIVFRSSLDRQHYLNFQLYLEELEKSFTLVDRQLMAKRLEMMFVERSSELERKAEVHIDTNFEYYLGILFNRPMAEFPLIIDQIVKFAPNQTKALAGFLLESEEPLYQSTGLDLYQKVAATVPLEKSYEKASYFFKRTGGPFVLSMIPDDDGSATHEQFIIQAMTAINSGNLVREYLITNLKILSPPVVKALKSVVEKEDFFYVEMIFQKMFSVMDRHDFILYLRQLYDDLNRSDMLRKKVLLYLLRLKLDGEPIDVPLANSRDLSFYNELSGRSDPASLEVIKQAIKSSDQEIQKAGFKALIGRRDPESLQLIMDLFTMFPKKEQLVLKLQALEGRDTPTVLNFIKQNLIHREDEVREAAALALKGMSSKESGAIWERGYLKSRDSEEKSFFIDALTGRPERDLVYLVTKYSEDSDLLAKTASLLEGKHHPEVVKLCQQSVLSDQKRPEFKVLVSCLNYIKSLPVQLYLSFWREALELPRGTTGALTAMDLLLSVGDIEGKKYASLMVQKSFEEGKENFTTHLMAKLHGFNDPDLAKVCFKSIEKSSKNVRSSTTQNIHESCMTYLSSLPQDLYYENWKSLKGVYLGYSVEDGLLILENMIKSGRAEEKKKLYDRISNNLESHDLARFIEIYGGKNEKMWADKCVTFIQTNPKAKTASCLRYLASLSNDEYLPLMKMVAESSLYSTESRLEAMKALLFVEDADTRIIFKNLATSSSASIQELVRLKTLYSYLVTMEQVVNQKSHPVSDLEYFSLIESFSKLK